MNTFYTAFNLVEVDALLRVAAGAREKKNDGEENEEETKVKVI